MATLDEVLGAVSPTAIHGEAVAGRAYEVRTALSELNRNTKNITLTIAELLEEAKRCMHYQDWGFESIIEYGEKELGLKPRKVQYLIKIIEVCNTLSIPREYYESVDISKLREITSLDPAGSYFNPVSKLNESLSTHISNLMAEAHTLSTDQIAYEVLKLKGRDGPDRPVVRSFSCTQETWDKVISKALELARKKLGSKGRDSEGNAIEYSDGVCYEMMAADFLADPNNGNEF